MRCYVLPPDPYTVKAWVELFGTPATIVEQAKGVPTISATHRLVALFDSATRPVFAAVIYDQAEMALFESEVWKAGGDEIRWFLVPLEHLQRVSQIEAFERRIEDWKTHGGSRTRALRDLRRLPR